MHAQADSRPGFKTALILLFLVTGGFVFRTVFAVSVMPPPSRMQGETTQAYRYTEMVSNGTGIPAVDTLVMRPDGMITGENSIFEEYIAGGIHRVTGGDLNTFLRVFCSLFPLLVLPVIFYWMRLSGFSLQESFSGSALYAVFLPALLRTRGESFYRETVALPLIILTLALLDDSKERRNTLKYSVSAAVVFFLALASWKVTGFISLFVFAWLAFKRPGLKTVVPMVVSQLLASVLLSHMRHDGALFSPATFMATAAVIASFCRNRAVPWAGLAVSAAAGFLFRSSSSGHVASVIAAKLRFFFSHPENPALLSGDARLFWVSGYTSPSFGEFVLLFGLAAVACVFGWKRFRSKAGKSAMFFLVPLSVAGYLFFDRLHVLLAVALVPLIVSASRGKTLVLPFIIALFGVQAMSAPWIVSSLSEVGFEFENSSSLLTDRELNDLLSWAGGNRGTVLCFWHVSGLLSAYADMPVVTHTFFENTSNRNTIVRFAERIYGDEQEMIEFMEAKGAEYLVYQADFVFDRTFQGLLYLAALRGIPDGCLAVRLHYYPQSLERLKLVWQGPSIRVYRLDGEPVQQQRQPLWEVRYAPFLQNREMAGAVVNSPVEAGIHLADQGMNTGDMQRISAALLLMSMQPDEVPADAATGLLQELLMAHLSGEYPVEQLEEDFVAYLDAWGPDPQLRFDLVRLLRNSNLYDRADYHMEIIENQRREGL
jgi:hypothetical protein